MKKLVTFGSVLKNEEINILIKQADLSLKAIGYTEHSFAHVGKCVNTAAYILSELGYDEEEIEIAKIAAYMHDIGNVVNRSDHAQSGALMAFQILTKMGMDAQSVAKVVTAIGNHDENTAYPVNAITAALILADKTDVRRSRVRNIDLSSFDIHDRVNYAVVESRVELNKENKTFSLILKIDTSICAVMDYFEIFLVRMKLCRLASKFFDLTFKLFINESVLI